MNTYPNWPVSIETGEAKPTINLTNLPDSEKRRLWDHIKSTNPNMAALLSEAAIDQELQALISTFDGEIEIEESEVQGFSFSQE